ncbi:MAG TPA: ABC transporter, partial [Rhodospirillaceae bacterium]|nr:ABC transporter [Rhodospirillaceae bacterium]
MNSTPALLLQDIRRSFEQAGNRLEVLRGCQLTIARGEKVALIGPSGAGKSTLLQIAGLLEKPDEGDIFVGGQKASGLDDAQRTALRRTAIGFVYQYHHLLPEFSARENIIVPQMIAGVSIEAAGKRADELLALINLTARADHRPAQLSGGEQQRIAIARALANKPAILIADEPTGNL